LNLKILFVLLLYYSLIGLVFAVSGDTFTSEGYNNTISLNSSELNDEEIDAGGFFDSGISFGRFTGLVFFGIGLPESMPEIFRIIFIAFQTMVTIIGVGWFISSIWNG